MKLFKQMVSGALSAVIAFGAVSFHIPETPASAALDAVALVEDMGQGWNLGNTFDSTNTWTTPLTPEAIETAWGNPVTTEAMIKEIKKSGFNTVRIPITWYQMIDSSGNPDSDYIARIKEVVDYVIDNGMYAIINTHHDEGDWLSNADSSTQTKFKTLWTAIAKYFAAYDQHLVFEAMNEQSMDNSAMMTMNQVFVDAVRATGGNNANRLLLVEASSNNTEKALSSDFSAPTDSANMIAVSVHYYEPSTFCVAKTTSSWGHQETWGTDADITKMQNDLDRLEKKFIDNGIPVIIGEYGVDTSAEGGKDDASLKKFLKEVAAYSLGKDGMCPVLWDMSVKEGTNGGEGDMYYFNRRTLEWYDSEIQQIFIDVAGGDSGSGTAKTDRLTFTATELEQTDEETGKAFYQIDLEPYREYGIVPVTAVVKFHMNVDSAAKQGSGDIAVSFNVNTTDGKLKYSNIDTVIGMNDTSATIDLALDEYNTAWDSEGAVSETSAGSIDMDYLKFENWWTWADEGDATVVFEEITVIFDGYLAGESGETSETTTAPTTTTTTETTTTTTVLDTTTTSENTPVGEVSLGDLDCDGTIAIADAVLLSRLASEDTTAEISEQGKKNADCDGDGSISTADVILVLRHLAGIQTLQ